MKEGEVEEEKEEDQWLHVCSFPYFSSAINLHAAHIKTHTLTKRQRVLEVSTPRAMHGMHEP